MADTHVAAPMPGVIYPPRVELDAYLAAGILHRDTLAAGFLRAFADHADRIALVGPAGPLTYRELDSLTDRAAAGFLRMGLQPLDRVVFQLPNGRDLVVAVIGCLKAGLIPICTLASHREIEIGYLAGHAAARAHVVPSNDPRFDFVGFAAAIRQNVPSLAHLVVCGGSAPDLPGAATLDQLIAGEDAAAARRMVEATVAALDPFQVAVFQLSGGTTGVPKIIPRFQNEYLYNMQAVAAFHGLGADDVIFCPGPFLHNAPMVCFWGPALLTGGTVIADHDVSDDGVIGAVSRHRPTWLYLPRPMIPRVKEALKRLGVEPDWVRGIVAANGVLEAGRALGVPAVPIFGMTEGVIMFGRPDDPQEALASGVGYPISSHDRIRILKPGTEEDVAEGETGELAIKGPYTTHGYYDAADRNRETFTSDGFYRSGDLMAARRAGDTPYYVFQGRLKDLISRGGEKINCEEVERLIRGYPGILDVALVGMPDPIYDERGCAFIIMAPGQPAPTVAQLGAWLGDQGLAKFKWPERIDEAETFPITKSGKLDKTALRRIAADLARQPPMLAGVHHSARPTWRLAETIAFYRDVLGLKLIHTISARGWGREGHPDFLHFFFDSGRGSTIAFFHYLGTDRPDYLEPRLEHNYRATHTAWRVDSPAELVAWKERLEKQGIEVSPYTRHEVIESIYFTDPNGYNLEITLQLRDFTEQDATDAALTLEAALAGGPAPDIDTVWRRKARLIEERFGLAAAE